MLTRAPSGDATKLEQVRAHSGNELGDAGRPHSGHSPRVRAVVQGAGRGSIHAGCVAPRLCEDTSAPKHNSTCSQPPRGLTRTRTPRDSQPGTAYVHGAGHMAGHTSQQLITSPGSLGPAWRRMPSTPRARGMSPQHQCQPFSSPFAFQPMTLLTGSPQRLQSQLTNVHFSHSCLICS